MSILWFVNVCDVGDVGDVCDVGMYIIRVYVDVHFVRERSTP